MCVRSIFKQQPRLKAGAQALASEMHNANGELERRERENTELRNNLSGGVLGADQRLQALDHEHTRLQAAVDRVRKENTDKLAEQLDVIIGFKDFARTKVDDICAAAMD
jgi:kinetochore protein NDC80